jgi:hypothetical protein
MPRRFDFGFIQRTSSAGIPLSRDIFTQATDLVPEDELKSRRSTLRAAMRSEW